MRKNKRGAGGRPLGLVVVDPRHRWSERLASCLVWAFAIAITIGIALLIVAGIAGGG